MTDIRRRKLLQQGAGLGALAATGLLAGCGPKEEGAAGPARPTGGKPIHWKMVTTWPLNFPGLGSGANDLAQRITRMSGGRLVVKVYGAGEMVPAFETFDAVSSGTAEMGHSSAYYWKGKMAEAQFFSTVPFGMTAMEMNAWLYHGDGLKLWRETYAPFGVLPFPAGNTGVQMGGWFNRPIESLDDLKGLKMRIPGLGGEVLKKLGGTPVNLPGAELFTALQTGALDATEWVGPYNDLAFGLYKAARYYYAPGWHEPGTTLELIVNRQAFEALPEDLQAIVESAAMASNNYMLSEFMARNPHALQSLMKEHGIQPRHYPEDVLQAFRQAAGEVVQELADSNAAAGRIHQSYQSFMEQSRAWSALSERAYLEARDAG